MAKLASIEDLRNALNRSNDSDTNRILNSALEAVTPAISGYLQTGFGRQEEKDVDTFLPTKQDHFADGRLVFKLRNSLLVTGSVVIRSALDNSELAAADPIPDMGIAIDTYRGYVTLLPGEVAKRENHWFQIEYLSGFNTAADQIGRYYTGVPEWLKQAALLTAMEVYDSLRKYNDTETSGTVTHLPGLAVNSLAPYRRGRSPVARPM